MKTMLALLAITLPMLVRGQPAKATTEPAFKNAAGAFFALSVPDAQASARWYAEKLGLTVVMGVPRRDGVAVVVLEGGGLIVELIQLDGALPLKAAAPAAADRQFVHGVFKAGAIVEDFERTLATLKARQVEIAYGPFPARDKQRANVVIRDNSGNLIQFFGK